MVFLGGKPKEIELHLLFTAGIYLLIGGILVSLLPGTPAWQGFLAIVTTIGGFLGVHWMWRKRNFHPDPFLLPLLMVLTATGILFLLRLDSFYGLRQLVWMIVGLCVLSLTTSWHHHYRFWSKYKYMVGAVCAFALLAPVFFGIEVGGTRSWLDFKVFYLQPSEFVKLFLVLFLAVYLSEKRYLLMKSSGSMWERFDWLIRQWGPLLGVWVISLALLIIQRDLGMAIIYFFTSLVLIYVSTDSWKWMAISLSLFLVAGIIAYFNFSHVHTRVEIWLNPWQQGLITGSSYQIVQSLLAINAGGMIGSGFGAGYPGFIPAVHTDFIFAAICEEMGLLGGAAIILLYIALFFRGFSIALKAHDDYGALLATGLTVVMALQVFIIIGGVIKLLPLTGITLPYISYGGSSLVANFILMGLLMNVSHCKGDFHA